MVVYHACKGMIHNCCAHDAEHLHQFHSLGLTAWQAAQWCNILGLQHSGLAMLRAAWPAGEFVMGRSFAGDSVILRHANTMMNMIDAYESPLVRAGHPGSL